jgi:hypothetical protein
MLAAIDDHPDFDPTLYSLEAYWNVVRKSRDYFSEEARVYMKDFDTRIKTP